MCRSLKESMALVRRDDQAKAVVVKPDSRPDEENPDVVLRALADQEVVARPAAGLVDEGCYGGPAAIVEHGVVLRGHDVLDRVLLGP